MGPKSERQHGKGREGTFCGMETAGEIAKEGGMKHKGWG
jgi:hypothetical protein